jgi:hypothetical protein
MPTGYCTVEDVRRALRKASLPGDVAQDPDIAVDAIVAQTEWLQKNTKRHWYVVGGIPSDEYDLFPSSANSRDDEHDIPTHGAFVHGASEHEHRRLRENSDALLEAGPRYDRHRQHFTHPKEEIRIALGRPNALVPPIDESVPAYTRITLDRRYVQAVNTLSVIDETGAYVDWVASSDFDGGVGNTHRGEDYWVRINNSGVSELYLDVHALDDDIASLSNAVYIDIDYGYEAASEDDTKVRNIRRAVALRAGADLVEDAAIQIPENATLYNVETKAEEMRATADELLDPYMVGSDDER